MIRFIPTSVHGAMDYVMGVLLMVGPWFMNWERGPEMWVPGILGATIVCYSLFTNYECGVVGMLPMTTHLTLDIVGGLVLAASPWIFGFAEQVWLPHVLLGLGEVAAGLMTQSVPSHGPPEMMRTRPSGR